MTPKMNWVKDWEIGIDVTAENEISQELLTLFSDYWHYSDIEEKSKTTRSRYRAALHALGGFIVEQAISEDGAGKSGKELIIENIGDYGGPLIYHDEESWQNELDIVCKKLFKYMKLKC